MGTDASTDQVPAALYGDQLELQSKLLVAIHDHVKRLPEQRTPFRVVVGNAVGAQTLSGTPLLSANRGEILTVHNPTAAPVTLLLVEDTAGLVLNLVIAANELRQCNVPFFGRLFAKNGAGAIVTGNVLQ